MPEQEPQYFKEFRKEISHRFDEQDKYILKTVTTVVEKAVDELAVITAKNFDLVNKDMRIMKDDIDKKLEKIDGHVGRYEVRTQKMERILFA